MPSKQIEPLYIQYFNSFSSNHIRDYFDNKFHIQQKENLNVEHDEKNFNMNDHDDKKYVELVTNGDKNMHENMHENMNDKFSMNGESIHDKFSVNDENKESIHENMNEKFSVNDEKFSMNDENKNIHENKENIHDKFNMNENQEKITNTSNNFSMNGHKCTKCKNKMHTQTINKFGKSELYCFACNK